MSPLNRFPGEARRSTELLHLQYGFRPAVSQLIHQALRVGLVLVRTSVRSVPLSRLAEQEATTRGSANADGRNRVSTCVDTQSGSWRSSRRAVSQIPAGKPYTGCPPLLNFLSA